MSLEKAAKIVNANPILIEQLMDLLPEEFEDEEGDKFLIEFAQASLEV